MEDDLVQGAPEHAMLRDRDDQPAAGPRHAKQFAEHAPVVVDVLEDVEDSDRIILPREGQLIRIRLNERHVRHACARRAKPLGIEIGSRVAKIGPFGVQLHEDGAVAASDLEEAGGLRHVLGERPLDQAVARTEPETPGLQLRERFKRVLRIGGRRIHSG